MSPAAATTRLPQMMYYQPPVDRSAVQAERATTPRVIVEATAAEAVDIAVDEKVAAQQSGVAAYEAAIAGSARISEGAEGAAPAQPAAKVISANIPVVDLPRIELPAIVAPEPKPISFDELRPARPACQRRLCHRGNIAVGTGRVGRIHDHGKVRALLQNGNRA